EHLRMGSGTFEPVVAISPHQLTAQVHVFFHGADEMRLSLWRRLNHHGDALRYEDLFPTLSAGETQSMTVDNITKTDLAKQSRHGLAAHDRPVTKFNSALRSSGRRLPRQATC